MLSGNLNGSVASNGISRAPGPWPRPMSAAAKSTTATIGTCSRRLMTCLLLLERDLLHAPRFDFRHDDLVRVAAVHHMDDLETARQLPGVPELANDRAVELHL